MAKYTLLATYVRESTLWVNANAVYKSTDWVKMECLFADFSKERADFDEVGMVVRDGESGEDISAEYRAKVLGDKYVVRLTNKSGCNTKDFAFLTKKEANDFFLELKYHRILKGWRKVR